MGISLSEKCLQTLGPDFNSQYPDKNMSGMVVDTCNSRAHDCRDKEISGAQRPVSVDQLVSDRPVTDPVSKGGGGKT